MMGRTFGTAEWMLNEQLPEKLRKQLQLDLEIRRKRQEQE
jgi:hypothetical protein